MNHLKSILIVALIALPLAYSPIADAASPTTRPTEVVIVSTAHFITDMPSGYTPGHLKALLDKIAPEVLAVEAAGDVPDPWSTAPYELAKVTRPWAVGRKVQAIPAGSDNPTYVQQINSMFADLRTGGKSANVEQLERDLQKYFEQYPPTCVEMNSNRAMDHWRAYHAELHKLYGRETPWEQWNDRIVGNVIAICRAHVGQRIAVVFGGAHAYYLTDRLSTEKDIRVIPAEGFLPLTDSDIQSHTADGDFVQAMRLLNFMPGTLTGTQLEDLQKKVDRLGASGKNQNDFRYFGAKLLLHQNKVDEATKILVDLSNTSPAVLLSFDGSTPVRDAARLQICFGLNQKGDAVAATKALRSLADDTGAAPSIRQAAKGMLDTMNSR